ncbi:MAG: hydrogenase maturation nickel metallochaperone HypA [bacterium]
MHEVSLMEETLELALEQARLQRAERIHAIQLRVGALSGAVPEALTFAFEAVTSNTIAEGARLEIVHQPSACYCATCRDEFEPADLFFECPRCHKMSTEIVRGRDLELISLEVS